MNKFFKDEKSGNIFYEMFCFPNQADELKLASIHANTTDAAQEKHVPVVEVKGNKVEVSVGSVLHPMQDVHLIEGVFLETKKGGQFHLFSPGEEPKTVFTLSDGDEPVAVYEYCNLHGLWKKEL